LGRVWGRGLGKKPEHGIQRCGGRFRLRIRFAFVVLAFVVLA
jgi:hypothetical protein